MALGLRNLALGLSNRPAQNPRLALGLALGLRNLALGLRNLALGPSALGPGAEKLGSRAKRAWL